MRSKETAPRSEWPKLQKGRQAPGGANKRLVGQIRKILREHYASKYRVQ